jgi:hypothetical protein
MADKLSARRIAEIHGALGRIRSLDETAGWIGKDIERDADEWGLKTRNAFGGNCLSQWRNEFLGQVVACAIINELMRERAEVAADIETLVDAPPAPFSCVQEPDREGQ